MKKVAFPCKLIPLLRVVAPSCMQTYSLKGSMLALWFENTLNPKQANKQTTPKTFRDLYDGQILTSETIL